MDRYTPASLPSITAVDVVVLRDIEANRVDEYMREAEGATSVTLAGEAAQRIASLWRQLPPDEMSRCHMPPFGLRFRSGGVVICQASVCWECNNIFGDQGGEPLAYGFDATASVARRLLAELRRAVGDPAGD